MATDPDAFMAYLNFVQQRHQVWRLRQIGAPQPWTDDPIVHAQKFTNVHRVLDHGSQYLLRAILDATSREDVWLRAFLYRFTNRPETWDFLRDYLGGWPSTDNLDRLEPALVVARRALGQVFSGAYIIMPDPGGAQRDVLSRDKTVAVARLTRIAFQDSEWLSELLEADTLEQRHAVLSSRRGVGRFMAMQIATDAGWHPLTQTDENTFVVAGPGGVRGARAVDPNARPEDTIAKARKVIIANSLAPLALPDGRVRYPSLMDVQNTFCEFSKYVRFQARGYSPRPYRPAHPGEQPAPLLPSHW